MVTNVQASTLRSLSTLCIFVALVFGTVESYKCIECTGDGNGCMFIEKTCETSQSCFNNKQQFIMPGNTTVTQNKGCSSSTSPCISLSFSATLGTGWTFAYQQQCCSNERCNKEDIQLSPVSEKENGIVCPACYTEDGKSCSPQPLNCTGVETKCVSVTGTETKNGVQRLKISAMGCATESACNLKDMSVAPDIKITARCVNPTSGSPPMTPIISSTLTGLLLLKVLL